jgi:hypothetical protein
VNYPICQCYIGKWRLGRSGRSLEENVNKRDLRKIGCEDGEGWNQVTIISEGEL